MGIYFIVFTLLFIFALQVQLNKKQVMLKWGQKRIGYDRLMYLCCIGILLYVSALSTNRSNDYFEYKGIFEAAPLKYDFSSYYIRKFHTELGWKLCCITFKKLGLSFEVFVGVVSVISLLLLMKFIRNFCRDRTLFALLWLYTSFFLVYFYIGIRSCLAISIFLSYMLPCLMKRKSAKNIFKYMLLTLLCASFHSVSWVFLLIPLVLKFRSEQLEEYFLIFLCISFPLYYTGIFNRLIGMLPVFFQQRFAASVTNIMLQLGYRLVFIAIVYFCHRKMPYTYENEVCYKSYLMGGILFVIFLSIPTLNVRIFDALKNLEIPIITSYLSVRKNKKVVFLTVMFVCILMYVHHISGVQIRYASFGESYNIFNYPFMNVLTSRSIK